MVTLIDKLEEGKRWELTFDLGAFSQQGRRMIVAGSFNGWSTGVRRVRNGFVAAGRKDNFVKLVLPAGDYEYKYYDLAKGEWMEVESHPELYRGFYWDYVRNPFGTLNCVVHVPHGGTLLPHEEIALGGGAGGLLDCRRHGKQII